MAKGQRPEAFSYTAISFKQVLPSYGYTIPFQARISVAKESATGYAKLSEFKVEWNAERNKNKRKV